MRIMSLIIQKRDLNVEVPSTGVLSGGMAFASQWNMAMPEPTIALFQLPLGIKELSLHAYQGYYDDDSIIASVLMENTGSSIFPGSKNDMSPLLEIPGLQELTQLVWFGGDVHWAVVRSLRLKNLQFPRTTMILSDAVPDETNNSLCSLSYTNHSSLTNPATSQYQHLKPFLPHFPALDELWINIDDDGDRSKDNHDGRYDINPDNHGTVSTLTSMLEPVASTLTKLYLHTAVPEKYRYAYWLNYVLSCDGFTQFKSLKNLVIPYQCLFGATDLQWSHIAPSPPELLPSMLDALDIEYPKVALLDWLARLSYFRDKLPALSDVGHHCVSKLGDAYMTKLCMRLTLIQPLLPCDSSTFDFAGDVASSTGSPYGTIMV